MGNGVRDVLAISRIRSYTWRGSVLIRPADILRLCSRDIVIYFMTSIIYTFVAFMYNMATESEMLKILEATIGYVKLLRENRTRYIGLMCRK